jgi:hypothetical protein
VLRRALGNCYMMAKREIARLLNKGEPHGRDAVSLERWQHVKRFCEETGMKSSILRATLPTELTEGGAAGPQAPPLQVEVQCRHCGEDIRFMDGEWLDRETHATCEQQPNQKHEPLLAEQSEDGELVRAITAIVREADETFQRVGGGSRHWVRDCFLPTLNKAGWKVARGDAARVPPSQELSDEQIDQEWRIAKDPKVQQPIRRLYETPALEVVTAIKRDYAPDLDENDGGQILAWILDLVSIAVITEVRKELRVACVPPATPQGWQPIETAPADERLLLFDGLLRVIGAFNTWKGFWESESGSRLQKTPTHWMPLPAAPATPQEK